MNRRKRIQNERIIRRQRRQVELVMEMSKVPPDLAERICRWYETAARMLFEWLQNVAAWVPVYIRGIEGYLQAEDDWRRESLDGPLLQPWFRKG